MNTQQWLDFVDKTKPSRGDRGKRVSGQNDDSNFYNYFFLNGFHGTSLDVALPLLLAYKWVVVWEEIQC